ncbi:putative hydro-lyase [Siculibacillus lacustris]|uniref:Putative hydro-lyase EYW49_03595 n=1 Tax=Siculibacillus lacustris TaxID=1549641 RepID=A0A4Q9VVH7_9HYPH|nr:putative hydro-lyase [Siculibacillus lacustris]TBW40276.1 putative hydro-lyase [Siculibacillus lacustris]
MSPPLADLSAPPAIRPSLAARLAARSGALTGSTAGLALGHAQANLAVLPAVYAADFLRFCQANPKPCPLLGVSEVGAWTIPSLGDDLDLRSDIPGYRIWRDGELVAEVDDASAFWRDDLVAFAIGCSYSFEEGLIAEDIPIRHIEEDVRVPMYRTSIDCTPAGVFSGRMVVSMRPLRPPHAIRAVQISSRYPAVHGAPVHLGLPHLIGIADLARPDYGDPVTVKDDEIPVFWACGVTPQSVIASARPSFAITHKPGTMLVTDRRNSDYAVI